MYGSAYEEKYNSFTLKYDIVTRGGDKNIMITSAEDYQRMKDDVTVKGKPALKVYLDEQEVEVCGHCS